METQNRIAQRKSLAIESLRPLTGLVLRLMASLLLFCLGSGCGQSGSGSPEEHEADANTVEPTVSMRLPDLSELDMLASAFPLSRGDASRQSSTINFMQDNIPLAMSGGVNFNGGSVEMLSGGGEFEWALYSYDPTGLSLELARWKLDSLGDQIFACRANFESSRWEFEWIDQGAQSVEVDAEDTTYLSSEHRGYLALGCAYGSMLRINEFIITMHQGQEIRSDVCMAGPAADMELLELDRRPAIAYQDLNTGRILFSHATSEFPAQPDDWLISEVDSGLTADVELELAVHQQAPAVLYDRSLGSELRLAWCGTNSPEPGTTWQHKQIISSALPNCFYSPQILSTGGSRLTAFYRRDTADVDMDGYKGYVEIAFPANGDLDGDWVSYRLHTAGAVPCAIALSEIDGLPALAFYNTIDSELVYCRADRTVPGPQHWTTHSVPLDADSSEVFLTELEGRPHVVVADDPTLVCRVLHAFVAQPAEAMDWEVSDSTGFVPGHFQLSSFEGKVFYCTSGETGQGYFHCFMWVQLGRDPLNLYYGNWGLTPGFSQIGISHGRIAVIADGMAAAYYEYDGPTFGRIRYCRTVYVP